MTEATKIQLPQGFVPAGTRLSGIYEIDAPLAKGGMGEIYRGHAIETGDPVAIKLIRADMADNEAALALFRREASALNRLHHEAIVRYFVFSLDPALQRHYLAMELVEGVSLSVLSGRGPLSIAEAHGLLKRLASGLHAAHERGIVHRDMSPDNVIVENGDVAHARIIDFGIARSTRVGDATVIGSGFAGKFNYVSPEQLGLYGADVTGKSDIYSLALVIVQCLRGKAIDMGGSQVDIIDKRRHVPDLSDIDTRIRPLLERMLQPDPADRPASMAEIAVTPLAGASKETSRRAAPAPRDRSKTPSSNASSGSLKWAMIAFAAVAFLGAAGFVAWLQFSEPWTPGPQAAAPPLDRPSANGLAPSDAAPQIRPEPSLTPEITPTALPVPTPQTGPTPTVGPAEQALRFIRDYDGGNCFLALPVTVTETSAEIDAFSTDSKPFDAMDSAFTKANGWEATIDGGQVTASQCAALRFVQALRSNARANAAQLEIDRTGVKSGETLRGSIISAAANLALLIVDNDGKLHDVTDKVTGLAPRRSFALRLELSSAGRPQPMLLMALGAARPLSALRAAGASDEVFSATLRDAAAQSGALEVAVKYFKVQ